MVGESQKRRIVLALTSFLLCFFAPYLSAQEASSEQKDSLVHLVSADYVEQIDNGDDVLRIAKTATFLHNDTYLICDSSILSQRDNLLKCIGNVRLLQGETELTSDSLDYLINDDLAMFRGGVVQLRDNQGNILRTRILDYNTRDSIAFFQGGASMQSDGTQVIESLDGSYSNAKSFFKFRREVNMYTDSTFVRTDSLDYDSNLQKAFFSAPIDIWQDENMLSSREGWYDRNKEVFFFTDNVHGLTDAQEIWSDSLYYYKAPGDLLLLGNAQVQDTTRSVAAVADYMYYQDTLSQVTLRKKAAAAIWQTKSTTDSLGVVTTTCDTTYMGANTIIFYQKLRCEIDSVEFRNASSRLADILSDPIGEYRIRAAEDAIEREKQAQKAKEEARERERNEGNDKGKTNPSEDPNSLENGGLFGGQTLGTGRNRSRNPLGGSGLSGNRLYSPREDGLPTDDSGFLWGDSDSLFPWNDWSVSLDSLPSEDEQFEYQIDTIPTTRPAMDSIKRNTAAQRLDSLRVGVLDTLAQGQRLEVSDSLASFSADSLVWKTDSLAVGLDSLSISADSLAVVMDSLQLAPKDSTAVGFVLGLGDVRIFRADMQIRCDSLRFTELDSIACFHKDPIIWNEEKRQYTADSLFVLIRDGKVDRASLISNAFIAVQEDSVYFDQIKSSEVLAYFGEGTKLTRFDALGGVSALFYLNENDQIATVNKVATKMLSAHMNEGELERVFYFDSPKNDAYPVVQLPANEHVIKGLNWQGDRRLKSKTDVTDLVIRQTQRREYESHSKAQFSQTDDYFPGLMSEIQASIQRAKLEKASREKQRDSLEMARRDSLALTDSLAHLDSLALTDSLFVGADSLGVLADSLSGKAALDSLANIKNSTDSLAVADSTSDFEGMTPRQIRRALRIARRDAAWAAKDAKDAAKLKVKQDKKEAKRQKRLEKQRLREQKQEEAEKAQLEKYIEYYEKQKNNHERKDESIPSGERPSGVEAGGEVPAVAELGPETT